MRPFDGFACHSCFVILSSFVLRHSAFIRGTLYNNAVEPTPPRDAITTSAPAPKAAETGIHRGPPPSGETGGNGGVPSIERSGRETMLAFMLIALLGGIVFFFLNFVSFGVFFYVLAAVAGIMAVGFLHYVLWGYGMSRELADEMERERLIQQQEMDERL
jgi:hypothetical protein